MAQSTSTESITFTLQKYSKSYPKTVNAPYSSEWQHFTNPTIRLTLDIRKSSNAELDSVRIRIIWCMNAESQSDRNDVVFEDLDLLSFSRLGQPQTKAQSLPLKAVHRDSVVGIRYLHPLEYNANPVYRRFQITFLSPIATAQFIDYIRTVCPCKANVNEAATAAMHRTMTSMPQFPGNTQSPSLPASAPTGALSAMHYHNNNNAVYSQPTSCMENASYSQPLSRMEHTGFSQPPSRMGMSMLPPPVPNQDPYLLRPSTAGPLHQQSPIDMQNLQNLTQQYSASTSTGQMHQQAQSQPLSSTSEGRLQTTFPLHQQRSNEDVSYQAQATNPFYAPPLCPEPSPASTLPNSSASAQSGTSSIEVNAMLQSIQQATGLYNLSPSALDNLVGDIVREDGFTDLMSNLSTLWKIKGYVAL